MWAATGWFLERFRQNFAVPDRVLARIERQRPLSYAIAACPAAGPHPGGG